MAIHRRAPNATPLRANVRVVTDLPGFEAGRLTHAGDCPLRGQVQFGGVRGPLCSPRCADSAPVILVEMTHAGLVLGVDDERRIAVVWDFLQKRPSEIPLPDDDAFPAQADVDALPGVVQLHEEWLAWRELEQESRESARRKAAEAKEQRRRDVEEREELERQAREKAEAIAEAAKQRAMASIVRPGRKVRVVADPPGFQERNARLKPRNREPSMIGMGGLCIDGGYGPHIFMRLPDGSTKRVLRSAVRVVFADGSLGDEDTSHLPGEPTPSPHD